MPPKRKTRAQRAEDHEKLRSVGFRVWIDDMTLRVIKTPSAFVPASMTITGPFHRIQQHELFEFVRYQGSVAGFSYLVSRKQIRSALDRLVAALLVERIYEPPPPPPPPWTESERRTLMALSPPGKYVALVEERARAERAFARGRGKTYYRAIGLLEAIARASQ